MNRPEPDFWEILLVESSDVGKTKCLFQLSMKTF